MCQEADSRKQNQSRTGEDATKLKLNKYLYKYAFFNTLRNDSHHSRYDRKHEEIDIAKIDLEINHKINAKPRIM